MAILIIPLSAYANNYYDASREKAQIQGYLKHIDSYEYNLISKDAEQTMAWHNLSPYDMAYFQTIKHKVDRYLKNFGNWGQNFYDASIEFNQAQNLYKQGLYLETQEICYTVMENQNLSFGDCCIFEALYERAGYAYRAYLDTGFQRISSNKAIQVVKNSRSWQQVGAVQYDNTDLGDCYLITGWYVGTNAVFRYLVFNDGDWIELEAGTDQNDSKATFAK